MIEAALLESYPRTSKKEIRVFTFTYLQIIRIPYNSINSPFKVLNVLVVVCECFVMSDLS